VPAKVAHLKKDRYAVRIGRKSTCGNPSKMGKDGTREDVIVEPVGPIIKDSPCDVVPQSEALTGCE
jgi:hypothetical protein